MRRLSNIQLATRRPWAVCIAMMCMPACAGADDAEIETVVVTGSRIKAESPASTAPVTVVARGQLLAGANDSLGKTLQALPYNTGSAPNTNVNNGGDGAVRVNLRALGPQRTLILLDGRRLPNGGIGGDSSVDVDALPLSMIERVEILTTGASAIYGADAIGGVVNVITRADFDGLELGAQRVQSTRGDGAISRAQLSGGAALGGGHWMLGVDRVEQEPVLQGERTFSAVPIGVVSSDGTRGFAGNMNVPQGRFRLPAGNSLGLPPGMYTHVDGGNGRGAGDYRAYEDTDAFNFAPYNYLQTSNTRNSLWVIGNQPLTESVDLIFEGLVRRRESSQRLAPTPFTVIDGFAPANAAGIAVVPADNYYNPFGVDLRRPVTRRLVELADRGYQQRVDLWRALAGVRGEVRGWEWEFTYSDSRSDALTQESGLALGERTTRALGPSGPDAAGNIVCGARDPATGRVAAANIITDCVPLNLFGGAGSITPEQLGYISAELRDRGSNEQRIVNLNATGAWGSTAAGAVQWAVGGEWRHEAGAYVFDALRASGTAGQGLGADIPGGRFDAREVFAEARVPLANAESRVGAITATAGVRHSSFSSFGEADTFATGLRWQPWSRLAVRAEYARLFRAPSISELFQAQATGPFGSEFDPCEDPTAGQRTHCAANGVPGGSYERTEDFYDLSVGGNSALRPERGYSFDAGVELNSAHDSSWSASLDYFRTELDGFLSIVDDATVLAECADFGTPLACAKIHRFADGSLERIDLRVSNLGSRTVAGFDLAAQLSADNAAGNFTARILATHLAQVRTQVFEGSTRISNEAGSFSDGPLPKWRALAGVNWRRERWSAAYNLQWIGGFTDCSLLEDGEFCGRVDQVLYQDIEAGYRAREGLMLRIGVSNLTDRQPPFIDSSNANTDAATYRLLGRLWFAQFDYSLSR